MIEQSAATDTVDVMNVMDQFPAFADDLCDWAVTLQERPKRHRWQPAEKRTEPATVTVTVSQQMDPLSAEHMAKRENKDYATWRTLKVRPVPYVPPVPTCVKCDKPNVLDADGMCRGCKVKAANEKKEKQGVLFKVCVDCPAEIKGTRGAIRCAQCASLAVKYGKVPQKTFHTHCRQCHARLGMYNESGYCQTHGHGKRKVAAA